MKNSLHKLFSWLASKTGPSLPVKLEAEVTRPNNQANENFNTLKSSIDQYGERNTELLRAIRLGADSNFNVITSALLDFDTRLRSMQDTRLRSMQDARAYDTRDQERAMFRQAMAGERQANMSVAEMHPVSPVLEPADPIGRQSAAQAGARLAEIQQMIFAQSLNTANPAPSGFDVGREWLADPRSVTVFDASERIPGLTMVGEHLDGGQINAVPSRGNEPIRKSDTEPERKIEKDI